MEVANLHTKLFDMYCNVSLLLVMGTALRLLVIILLNELLYYFKQNYF